MDSTTSPFLLGRERRLPAFLKVLSVAYSLAVLAGYWPYYGPANFLWFSNLALFLVTLGILLDSPLLVSMPAVGVFLLEVGWTVDLLLRLALRGRAFGITEYLWDASFPLPLRLLTLYHLALPPLLWWLTGRLGYDRRAFSAWLALASIAAVLVLLLTDPRTNINRLWGFGADPQHALPTWLFLLLWIVVVPGCFWWPTHRLMLWARPAAGAGRRRKARRVSLPVVVSSGKS